MIEFIELSGLLPIPPFIIPVYHIFSMWFLSIDQFPSLANLL